MEAVVEVDILASPPEGSADTQHEERQAAPEPTDSAVPTIPCHEPANDFHTDLNSWVTEVSEVFHYRVFFIELLGQLLYSILGPLSYPALFLLYGSKVGLLNRGFWIFRIDLSAVSQFLTWACLFSSLIATYFFDEKHEITLIEKKLAIIGLLLRNMPVATKYAYTSTPTWMELNTRYVDLQYRMNMNLLGGWLRIPAENFALQAEVAFVTVIGSRKQRSQTLLKFLPWPRSEAELTLMRERVDITSKTMFYAPTGRILRENSRSRKAEKEQFLQFDAEGDEQNDGLSGKHRMKADLGQIRTQLVSASSSCRRLPSDDTIPQPGLIDQHKDHDTDIFRAAASGQEVPIQDLFLYILRGVMRSERAIVPSPVWPLFVVTLSIVLLPSILRYSYTGYFLGTGPAAYIGIIGMWPSACTCFLTSSTFMFVGAKDIWRRRALMRSCAAMLSVQREFRRHCPAEVDMLPILDLSDVNTIVGWRKLRQLCNEWGKFYHVRIRAFTAQFFFMMLLIVADLLTGMLLPAYPKYVNGAVGLTSLTVTSAILALLIGGILAMVFLGNEVNASVERHVYLLYRQRSLMLATRFDPAAEKQKCKAMHKDPEKLAQCTELISGVCEELDFEGKVKPLTLFGLRLGWSLISALNFIPLGIATTVFSFCTGEEAEMCFKN